MYNFSEFSYTGLIHTYYYRAKEWQEPVCHISILAMLLFTIFSSLVAKWKVKMIADLYLFYSLLFKCSYE